jgi:hypothetical protein
MCTERGPAYGVWWRQLERSREVGGGAEGSETSSSDGKERNGCAPFAAETEAEIIRGFWALWWGGSSWPD